MSIRKIPKNYRNVTGMLTNPNTRTRHAFESTLERDYLLLLNVNSHVTSYNEQPVTISWQDATNQDRKYTPDVLINYDNAISMLVEIKYRSELREKWPELKPKFKAAIAFCRTQGWRFKIITEVEIRGPELKNIKFLNGFLNHTSDATFQNKCSELLAFIHDLMQTTPEELLNRVSSDKMLQAEWIPVLWHLAVTHQINVNLSIPLSMKSKIWSK